LTFQRYWAILLRFHAGTTMLIHFTVSNFLSFDGPQTLHLTASPERIHPHHVVRSGSRQHPNLLRTAAIYGANASGKSNLVKALHFLQELIVEGLALDERIPVRRFKLRGTTEEKPVYFAIEMRIGDANFLYSVELDSRTILEETLKSTTNSSETLLFQRVTSPEREVKVEFGVFHRKLKAKEQQILEFVAKGTRPNQTFLHETIERNLEHFRPVFDWMKKSLTIITPNTTFLGLERNVNKDEGLRDFLGSILQAAGTGIVAVRTEVAPIGTQADLPEELLEDAQKNLTDGKFLFGRHRGGMRFAITKHKDELVVFRLRTVHMADGKEVLFDVHEESDGTQRLFDLAPMLDGMLHSESTEVFVVDEIDRSLHPHLTRMILEMHLAAENQLRPVQLVFTTHETHLLDLDLLRRDEIWFAEKNLKGATELYSLSDFQPRFDKAIRQDYLLGRYGGIPFIGSPRQLRLQPTEMNQEKTIPVEGADAEKAL
jgi:uncharacterized protein